MGELPSRRAVLLGAVRTIGVGTAARWLTEAAPSARQRVRFGLNYTPSRHWWYVWQQWDPARVDHDLAQIAGLGADHVRIQLRWDVFQPSPDRVRPEMLSRLSTMLDLAGRHRLDVCVSLLTGFLSGKRFIPPWAAGNLATAPGVVKGELTLFREVGRAIGRHPHLLGFDIGNELLGRFPGTSTPRLQSWCDELIAAARAAAPGKLHSVSGVSKFLAAFPTILSTAGDVSVVHPWYFYGGAVDKHGGLTPTVERHVELNVEYIKSFHDFDPAVPRRKVWVQEVGAPDSTIPTRLHQDFVTATMRNALSCEDLYGITWWDSHDIDTGQLPQFSPPESTLGLFDDRGRLKPAGHTFTSEIARWKRGQTPLPRERHLAVRNVGPGLWQRLSDDGARPAMVPSQRARDQAYLSERGITRVVDAKF